MVDFFSMYVVIYVIRVIWKYFLEYCYKAGVDLILVCKHTMLCICEVAQTRMVIAEKIHVM